MTNHTTQELEQAFDSVCDPADWKAPIRTPANDLKFDLDLVKDSIEYFTATVANFETDNAGAIWLVADGYRMGPAGP